MFAFFSKALGCVPLHRVAFGGGFNPLSSGTCAISSLLTPAPPLSVQTSLFHPGPGNAPHATLMCEEQSRFKKKMYAIPSSYQSESQNIQIAPPRTFSKEAESRADPVGDEKMMQMKGGESVVDCFKQLSPLTQSADVVESDLYAEDLHLVCSRYAQASCSSRARVRDVSYRSPLMHTDAL